MNKRTTLRLATIALTAAISTALSGCAYFNVGEEEFNCSGMPGSAYCHSTRDVYTSTNDGSVPSRVGKDGAYNEECDDCARSEGENFNKGGEEGSSETGSYSRASNTLNGQGDEVTNNYVSPRLPGQPVPIRTPAVVMRIWVAPWIDSNDDLNAPGYVYTEIEPRRWIYPDDYSKQVVNRSFEPLRQTNKPNYVQKTSIDGHNTLEKMKEKNNAQQRAR